MKPSSGPLLSWFCNGSLGESALRQQPQATAAGAEAGCRDTRLLFLAAVATTNDGQTVLWQQPMTLSSWTGKTDNPTPAALWYTFSWDAKLANYTAISQAVCQEKKCKCAPSLLEEIVFLCSQRRVFFNHNRPNF